MGDDPRAFASDAPLLVAGPPGVGKSTVGRLAAALLQRSFVDLDARVVARAGMSVAEIFARDGEASFRARERAELVAVLAEGSCVVALGGGTLVDPQARAHALERGVVVGLRAPIDTLAQRLSGDGSRPLLRPAVGAQVGALVGSLDAGTARRDRLEALLAARSAAYAEAHVHLDAARPPPAVARDVARAARDRWAFVPARDGGYPVRLTRDAGAGAADAAFALEATARVLVTDDRVGPIWADAAAATLAAFGLPVAGRLSFPHGERSKRLSTLETLADELAAMGADRRAALVCVGGGVVSDLGGLLAALHSRGIPWICVPTTLLSMVDAAVGGKTAVDLARAKNALGAFHPPRAVVVDAAHVRTEDPRQMRAGLAEAVKTALIGDADLYARMERDAEALREGDPDAIEEIVARSLAVKVGVVTRDERETGERIHLNLGHTFGHALEAAERYEGFLHGEGVAVGMSAALAIAEARGIAEPGLAARTRRLLTRLGLPTHAPAPLCMAAREFVGADKKRRGGRVELVVVRAPGAPATLSLSLEEAASALAEAAADDEVRPVF